jgi:hypothetical protein
LPVARGFNHLLRFGLETFYRFFNTILDVYFQRLCARQASLTRSKIADRR